MPKFLLTLTLFLLIYAPAQAQLEPYSPTGDRLSRLIDRLYSVEDFQQRFTLVLEANQKFLDNADDRAFLNSLTEDARHHALTTYITTIRTVLEEFSGEEVTALEQALDSPAGPAIVRLLVADQSTVYASLQHFVNSIVDNGLAAMVTRDSLLYHWESRHDLREIMDGEYLDHATPDMANVVRREGDLQIESVGDAAFHFDIEWLSNSKYSLDDREGNPISLGPKLVVNVYEIEGNEFRYIWKNPDGTYGKDVLFKTSFTSYEQEIKTFRYGLDEQYRNPATSPLPDAARGAFVAGGGHKYFPTEEPLRIAADFIPDTSGTQLTMPTSSGSTVTYAIAGKANFALDGKARELTLYRDLNKSDDLSNHLFLPFRDATSGQSTYGGGRYIEVPAPEDGQVTIDFNKAYNPYCAYTDGYACPVPPKDNTLKTAIEAGVMVPLDKAEAE